MKIDLHLHSSYSPDSSISPEELIAYAKKAGLDAVAVTDHNTLKGCDRIREIAQGSLVVVSGCELSTSEGHLLCIGLREEIIPGTGMKDAMDMARGQGAVAIPSHPFRTGTGCGRRVLERIRPSLIEGINGRNLQRKNTLALDFAIKHGMKCTGGSDAHSPPEIGRAYTVVDAHSEDDVISVLLKGECRPEGRGQGIAGSGATLKKIVVEYFRIGGHI